MRNIELTEATNLELATHQAEIRDKLQKLYNLSEENLNYMQELNMEDLKKSLSLKYTVDTEELTNLKGLYNTFERIEENNANNSNNTNDQNLLTNTVNSITVKQRLEQKAVTKLLQINGKENINDILDIDVEEIKEQIDTLGLSDVLDSNLITADLKERVASLKEAQIKLNQMENDKNIKFVSKNRDIAEYRLDRIREKNVDDLNIGELLKISEDREFALFESDRVLDNLITYNTLTESTYTEDQLFFLNNYFMDNSFTSLKNVEGSIQEFLEEVKKEKQKKQNYTSKKKRGRRHN